MQFAHKNVSRQGNQVVSEFDYGATSTRTLANEDDQLYDVKESNQI